MTTPHISKNITKTTQILFRRRLLGFEALEGRRVLSAIYYVDSVSGNDANNGTSETAAWGSLAKVNSTTLKAGDKVLLKRGASWTESLNIHNSGTASAQIYVGAYGTGNAPQIFRLNITGSETQFEDLLVDHNKQTGDAVLIRNGKNVTLRNLEIRNGANDGIDVDKANGLLIDGLHIHHFLNGSFTNQADAHGVVATDTDGLTIRNTEIDHVSGDSFQADPDRDATITTNVLIESSHFWTSPLDADFNAWLAGQRPGENAIDTKAKDANWDAVPRMKITVRDVVANGWVKDAFISNKAAFNMKEKIEAVFDGVTVYDSEIAFRLRGARGNANTTIKNAVVYDVEKAIRAEDNLANLKVYNSTFGDGILTQIQLASVSSGPETWEFRNNAYLGSKKPKYASDASNRLATAADFVGSATRDYHLSPQSTLIDMGVAIAGLDRDREATARPQGTAYDVGAYEHVPDDINISLRGFTADGATLLEITYEINGGAASPFDILFYSSLDSSYSAADTLLDTYRVTTDADLAAGVHTIQVPIGDGNTEVGLPGAGATETGGEYYLLAMADPADESSGNVDDNSAVFTGVYHLTGSKVFIHGTEAADKLVVQPTGLQLALNNLQYVYTDSVTPAVEARLYGGGDVLSGGGGDDLLSGGIGNDVYRFDADKKLGADTIVEPEFGGNDTFDFSTTTKQSIAVDLSTNTSIVNPLFTIVLATAESIENVTGGSLNDTILGTDSANRFRGGPGDDVLDGKEGDDIYVFDADLNQGNDTIFDSAGNDWLDFSVTTDAALQVDLSATGPQSVNPFLTLNIPPAVEHVIGGSQADAIMGNGLDNILIGGAGNDVIGGSAGRDFLIGGFDADVLQGGIDDDLMIGGRAKTYSESTKTQHAALQLLLDEWRQTAVDYATRIDHLLQGGGLNLANVLGASTISRDNSADQITGDLNRDWFLTHLEDILTDLELDEVNTLL